MIQVGNKNQIVITRDKKSSSKRKEKGAAGSGTGGQEGEPSQAGPRSEGAERRLQAVLGNRTWLRLS